MKLKQYKKDIIIIGLIPDPKAEAAQAAAMAAAQGGGMY